MKGILVVLLVIVSSSLAGQTIDSLREKVLHQQEIIKILRKENDSLIMLISKWHKNISIPKNSQRDSVVSLIQAYFACNDWEERLNYVTGSNEIKGIMRDYYSETIFTPKDIHASEIFILNNKELGDKTLRVRVNEFVYYILKIENEYKVDWLASIGYNQTPLKIFIVNKITKPTGFRLYATLGNYYNFEFRSSDNTHWNVKIHDSDGEQVSGCYVSKSTEAGKAIYEILKDGKVHQLFLEISMYRRKDNLEEIAIIHRLLRSGWSTESSH